MGGELVHNAFGVPMGSFTEFLAGFGRSMTELEAFGQSLPRAYFKDGEFAIDRTKSSDRVNRDDFITKSVTKVRINTDSGSHGGSRSGGGGAGRHRSSSGRSHGGGSRRC